MFFPFGFFQSFPFIFGFSAVDLCYTFINVFCVDTACSLREISFDMSLAH